MASAAHERAVLGIKRATAKVLVNRVTGRVAGALLRNRINSHGLWVKTQSPLIRPEVKALLALGMYESAERRLVTGHLRHDLPVVELGASIGYISGLISRLRPPRQIAVEANPALIQLIEELLGANDARDVRVLHGAIDYENRVSVRFVRSSFNTGGAILSTASSSNDATIDVPTLTLGSVIKHERIGLFALVCDIEGAEHAMIMHEDPAVIQACQQMIIELHGGSYTGRNYSALDLVNMIQERWHMEAVRRDGNNWIFQREGDGGAVAAS